MTKSVRIKLNCDDFAETPKYLYRAVIRKAPGDYGWKREIWRIDKKWLGTKKAVVNWHSETWEIVSNTMWEFVEAQEHV